MSPGTLFAGIPALRSLKTSRQRPPYQASALSPLSTFPAGLLHLLGLSQTLRGLLNPFKADARLQHDRRTQLDRLYQRVVDDLDALVRAVGLNLKAA